MRPGLITDIAICGTPTAAVIVVALLLGPISSPSSRISELKGESEATMANPVAVETLDPPSASAAVVTIPAPEPTAIPAPAVLDHQSADSDAAAIPARGEPATSPLPVPPEHKPPDTRLSAQDVPALRARGDALLRIRDIGSARLFYQRAAEAGDGQAALLLGETYDPAFLSRSKISGIAADSETAKFWYRRAAELGAKDAKVLLKSMTGK
jgi:hypothetical protein